MATARQTTAAEKQSIARKVVSQLKKRYKGPLPKDDRPILETVIYAICLENSSYEEAEKAYRRLETDFFDLNEVRVSSITELAATLEPLSDPEWRALRIRSILHFVFEKNFAFDFEGLRRKTLELATRQLDRIKELSPFVRCYTLQATLGSHLVPIDDACLKVLAWLGLVSADSTVEEASEGLKSAVRKSDVPQFCYYLRRLATDPGVARVVQKKRLSPDSNGPAFDSALDRLNELCKLADARPKRSAGKSAAKSRRKTATRKKPAKTSAGKKKAPAKRKTKKKVAVKRKTTRRKK